MWVLIFAHAFNIVYYVFAGGDAGGDDALQLRVDNAHLPGTQLPRFSMEYSSKVSLSFARAMNLSACAVRGGVVVA